MFRALSFGGTGLCGRFQSTLARRNNSHKGRAHCAGSGGGGGSDYMDEDDDNMDDEDDDEEEEGRDPRDFLPRMQHVWLVS